MQNYCKTIGALAAASALAISSASAQLEFEMHTGYTTEYIFRGVDLGDDLIEFGLDTAYTSGAYTGSVGMWGAYFGDAGTPNAIDSEYDFYAESAYDFGVVTGAIGYIYYWNVGSFGVDSQEVYFSVSKELYGFETSLTYFWDVAGFDNDGYTELYVGYGYDINECLALNVGGTLSYLEEQGKLGHYALKTSLDWAFSENATVSPFVQYSINLSSEGPYVADKDELIAGSILAVSF